MRLPWSKPKPKLTPEEKLARFYERIDIASTMPLREAEAWLKKEKKR